MTHPPPSPYLGLRSHRLHIWPRLLDNLTLSWLQATYLGRNSIDMKGSSLPRTTNGKKGRFCYDVSCSLLTGTSSLLQPSVTRVYGCLSNKQRNK